MIHELKIWPQNFEELRIGAKAFEVRAEKNDGGPRFEGGDVLRLREWDPQRPRDSFYPGLPPRDGYTGRVLDVQVTSILRLYDTPNEWRIRDASVVVMGIRLLTESAFTRAAQAEETGPGDEP